MRRPSLLALFLVAASGACGHQIGDSCTQNVDCSPLGDRFCDISGPGGYCTIEGCDVQSCPSEASCVRFFSPDVTRSCESQSECGKSERCLCDCGVPGADGKCPIAATVASGGDGGFIVSCTPGTGTPEQKGGHCAAESSEHRWCQKTCSSDGDCRAGYRCRTTGTLGTLPVPYLIDTDSGVSSGQTVRFCVKSSF